MNEPPKKSKIILIAGDGAAGHEQQSRALCAGMGFDFETIHVEYPSKWRKLLSYAFDRLGVSLGALYRLEGAELRPGKFAAVVGTGSTAFYPARVIARKLGVPAIAVLSPRGYRLAGFDCILSPGFDRLPRRKNVVATPVNLTQVGDDFYARGVADFEARHARDPGARSVGVIIGGENHFTRMDAGGMRKQLEAVFSATEGMARWVTTSRRTPTDVERVVRETAFDYKLVFSEDPFNPIPAFVMLCDTLFVTSDSTGMISEAVTRGGARVEILMNLRKPGTKYGRFIGDLERMGCVHCFEGRLGDARAKVDLKPVLRRVAEVAGLQP